MFRHLLLLVLGLSGTLLLTACGTTPSGALSSTQVTANQRTFQTRHFEQVTESALLAASLGVLQDLGFTLDGSESQLGVITASRQFTGRRSLNTREIVTDVVYAALMPGIMLPYFAVDAMMGVKEPQVVSISLVTSPVGSSTTSSCGVRMTAQRRVYKDEKLRKLIKMESVEDPAFYQELFTRLARSVALEEQKT